MASLNNTVVITVSSDEEVNQSPPSSPSSSSSISPVLPLTMLNHLCDRVNQMGSHLSLVENNIQEIMQRFDKVYEDITSLGQKVDKAMDIIRRFDLSSDDHSDSQNLKSDSD